MAKKAAKKRFGHGGKGIERRAASGRSAAKPVPSAKRARTAKRTKHATAAAPAPAGPQARIATVEVEMQIGAAPSRVWDALVKELAAWWPKDFHALQGADKMILEPWAGGRLYEKNAAGAELLWANVMHLEPGKTFTLFACIAPPWGGPTLSIVSYTLRPEGPGTMLKLSDALLGRAEKTTTDSMTQGWTYLMNALKSYVEAAR